MTSGALPGLAAFHWIALLLIALVALLLADALIGHYRTGFRVRAQYAPFVIGATLIAAASAALIAPGNSTVRVALSGAGWLAAAGGVAGTVFHHWYGVRRQPGGYSWLLHHLMYKAPPLAPLTLAALGILALITANGLTAGHAGDTGGLATGRSLSGRAVLLVVGLALIGTVAQSLLLHYRGAFHDRVMYAPAVAPVAAAAFAVWQAVSPANWIAPLLIGALWLSIVTGFIGLGMHLRGLDRHHGGLYVGWATLLEGPPPFAPAQIAGFAAVGLIAQHLLPIA
ncbi:MAG TPA: hypothetical protein VMM17_12900 [Gemmatimonadaceae bacterium]|nr:hypothetical protein [Gemmatimonadaceae bacterium]